MKKKCHINYYGLIAEVVGTSSEQIDLELDTNQNARELFVNIYPKLKNFPFQVALDTKLVKAIDNLDFQTISLLPPFSGG